MLQSKQSLFYACYLLVSLAPSKKNVVYIGSTPNPIRRLRQHNGEISGGAKKTIKSRPWEMAIVVYGFTSKFAALQFEWAWQNPHKSRHFKEKEFLGKQSERFLLSKLKALYLMLNLSHFQRWPLNLHFTLDSIYCKFISLGLVNKHVKLTIGSLQTLEYDQNEPNQYDIYESNTCTVCSGNINIEELNGWLTCSERNCPMISHLFCLSNRFLDKEKESTGTDMLIPLNGTCPICTIDLKWGSLIKSMKSRLLGYQLIKINEREQTRLADRIKKEESDEECSFIRETINFDSRTPRKSKFSVVEYPKPENWDSGNEDGILESRLPQNNIELIVLDDDSSDDEFSLTKSFRDLRLEIGY
ncbi:Slx4p interacting protein [Boothiomyces sp. JEL0866]|nr:Slx4p interacting protein [Boothiomyces sp. JEL0866]